MARRVKRWRISDIMKAVAAQPGVRDEMVREYSITRDEMVREYSITRGEAADCVVRDLSVYPCHADDAIRRWHAFIPFVLGVQRLRNGYSRADDEEVERVARVLVAEARRLKVPRRA